MSSFKTWFKKIGAPVLAGVVSLTLMLLTYRIGWWPIDDSIFAYLGERLLNGGVFGVDVFDFHGGYHAYLNMFLFKLFGVDTAVLRYPFLVIPPLQTMMAAYMLRYRGFWIAFFGGLSMTTLTFMLFPNPSPNWYALFFAVVSVFILTEWEWKPSTLFILGFVWGLCFMFRHPSAAFLLMGIVAYGLYRQRTSEAQSYSLHHMVLLIFIGAVLVYIWAVFEWFGFLLFGLPPLVLSVLMFRLRYKNFPQLLLDAVWACFGAVAAAMPMVVYQLLHGDVLSWIKTSFFTGMSMVSMEFFHSLTYVGWFTSNLAEGPGFPLFIIFIICLASPAVAPIVLLGGVIWHFVWRPATVIPPAVFVAIFYGLVSFYFQVEFYFFVGMPLVLLALLLLFNFKTPITKLVVVFCLINLQLISLFWFAPSFATIRFPNEYVYSPLPKTSLVMHTMFRDQYVPALSYIETYTKPGDVIYTFPFNPEFYYLSGRQNAFASMGNAFAVRSEEDYQNHLAELKRIQPGMIIMVSNNFYFSEYDWRLLAKIQSDPNYKLVSHENFIFYFARKPLNEILQNDTEDSLESEPSI